jgi:hypothetical protein
MRESHRLCSVCLIANPPQARRCAGCGTPLLPSKQVARRAPVWLRALWSVTALLCIVLIVEASFWSIRWERDDRSNKPAQTAPNTPAVGRPLPPPPSNNQSTWTLPPPSPQCAQCRGTRSLRCSECGGSRHCAQCRGTGVWRVCPECNGTGRRVCLFCGGRGCAFCGGRGREWCVCCFGVGMDYCRHCLGNKACPQCGGKGATPCPYCESRSGR